VQTLLTCLWIIVQNSACLCVWVWNCRGVAKVYTSIRHQRVIVVKFFHVCDWLWLGFSSLWHNCDKFFMIAVGSLWLGFVSSRSRLDEYTWRVFLSLFENLSFWVLRTRFSIKRNHKVSGTDTDHVKVVIS